MQVSSNFQVCALTFHLVALDPIAFPRGKAANTLRGALGLALRKGACAATCRAGRGLPTALCKLVQDCDYAWLFEPPQANGGPSGLRNYSGPFVIRASHLDGAAVAAGQPFAVDVRLFDLRSPRAEAALRTGMARAGADGLGPRNGRAELVKVKSELVVLPLSASGDHCKRIRVEFLTPTELKVNGGVAKSPEFGVFFQRVRDRVSMLHARYGGERLALDFRGMGDRAARVRMEAFSVAESRVERRSSRTGQTHGIGGFTGWAEYAGDLDEFLPWLRAAEWTGVGRQTVWGKGTIRVETLP